MPVFTRGSRKIHMHLTQKEFKAMNLATRNGMVFLPTRSKYNAKRTPYGGRVYASKAEANYAAELDIRLKASEIRGWEPQVSFPLRVNNVLICRYVVDFRVEHLNGEIEWVEVKGKETDAYKIKKKLFDVLYLSEHPGERFTLVRA